MGIYLSLAIQEKEVFLKRIYKKIIIFIIFFISININAQSLDQKTIKDLYDYFNKIDKFSSIFLQENNGEIQSGALYKKENRIRIQYTIPEKIRIIFSSKKTLYFNEGLQEITYFNTKKSAAYIFFQIFNYSKIWSWCVC